MSECLRECLVEARLAKYYPAFDAKGISTTARLLNLSMSDYAELGIQDMEDRKRLFRLVQIIKSVHQSSLRSSKTSQSRGRGKVRQSSQSSEFSFTARSEPDNEKQTKAKVRSLFATVPVYSSTANKENVRLETMTKPAQRSLIKPRNSGINHAHKILKNLDGKRNASVERIVKMEKFAYGLPKMKNVARNICPVAERIKVCVRKRPLNENEIRKKERDAVRVNNDGSVVFSEMKLSLDLTKYMQQHEFFYDATFSEAVGNRDVYEQTAKPLVDWMFQGGKATCFVYGQTGAGKTYTVLGTQQVPGLYLLAARDIFMKINEDASREYAVYVSYYEIYCGNLFDLLNKRKRLQVREDGAQNVCISSLITVAIDNVTTMMQVVEYGSRARTTGTSHANADSSRSHAVLQIQLVLPRHAATLGKISFIDLAGSERAAQVVSSGRQTKQEGAEINTSLLALKECIRAMDQELRHTPFRQSKLTHILKDSFIGDCRTCMIANIAPTDAASEDTLNTLRYADRVKEIRRESFSRQQHEQEFIHRDDYDAERSRPVVSKESRTEQPPAIKETTHSIFHPSSVPLSSTPLRPRVGTRADTNISEYDSPIIGHQFRSSNRNNVTRKTRLDSHISNESCIRKDDVIGDGSSRSTVGRCTTDIDLKQRLDKSTNLLTRLEKAMVESREGLDMSASNSLNSREKETKNPPKMMRKTVRSPPLIKIFALDSVNVQDRDLGIVVSNPSKSYGDSVKNSPIVREKFVRIPTVISRPYDNISAPESHLLTQELCRLDLNQVTDVPISSSQKSYKNGNLESPIVDCGQNDLGGVGSLKDHVVCSPSKLGIRLSGSPIRYRDVPGSSDVTEVSPSKRRRTHSPPPKSAVEDPPKPSQPISVSFPSPPKQWSPAKFSSCDTKDKLTTPKRTSNPMKLKSREPIALNETSTKDKRRPKLMDASGDLHCIPTNIENRNFRPATTKRNGQVMLTSFGDVGKAQHSNTEEFLQSLARTRRSDHKTNETERRRSSDFAESNAKIIETTDKWEEPHSAYSRIKEGEISVKACAKQLKLEQSYNQRGDNSLTQRELMESQRIPYQTSILDSVKLETTSRRIIQKSSWSGNMVIGSTCSVLSQERVAETHRGNVPTPKTHIRRESKDLIMWKRPTHMKPQPTITRNLSEFFSSQIDNEQEEARQVERVVVECSSQSNKTYNNERSVVAADRPPLTFSLNLVSSQKHICIDGVVTSQVESDVDTLDEVSSITSLRSVEEDYRNIAKPTGSTINIADTSSEAWTKTNSAHDTADTTMTRALVEELQEPKVKKTYKNESPSKSCLASTFLPIDPHPISTRLDDNVVLPKLVTQVVVDEAKTSRKKFSRSNPAAKTSHTDSKSKASSTIATSQQVIKYLGIPINDASKFSGPPSRDMYEKNEIRRNPSTVSSSVSESSMKRIPTDALKMCGSESCEMAKDFLSSECLRERYASLETLQIQPFLKANDLFRDGAIDLATTQTLTHPEDLKSNRPEDLLESQQSARSLRNASSIKASSSKGDTVPGSSKIDCQVDLKPFHGQMLKTVRSVASDKSDSTKPSVNKALAPLAIGAEKRLPSSSQEYILEKQSMVIPKNAWVEMHTDYSVEMERMFPSMTSSAQLQRKTQRTLDSDSLQSTKSEVTPVMLDTTSSTPRSELSSSLSSSVRLSLIEESIRKRQGDRDILSVIACHEQQLMWLTTVSRKELHLIRQVRSGEMAFSAYNNEMMNLLTEKLEKLHLLKSKMLSIRY